MASATPSAYESAFRYSASATAFSGQIGGRTVRSDSCELPPQGGFEHRLWTPSRIGENLQVGLCTAEVSGQIDSPNSAFRTTTRISVENFGVQTILGRGEAPVEELSIGRMSATLVSSHPTNGAAPSFTISEMTFSRLRRNQRPAEIVLSPNLLAHPLTYDEAKTRFANVLSMRPIPSKEGLTVSAISAIQYGEVGSPAAGLFGVITLPNRTIVSLGELTVEPTQCQLTLARVQFGDESRSEVMVGSISLGGAITPSDTRDEPAQRSTNLDEEEEAEVLEELKDWLNTHPNPDQPFLFFMGRSLTPAEFFQEVEERTSFGASFLQFLSVQSRRFNERPRDAIRRAVDANRAE